MIAAADQSQRTEAIVGVPLPLAGWFRLTSGHLVYANQGEQLSGPPDTHNTPQPQTEARLKASELSRFCEQGSRRAFHAIWQAAILRLKRGFHLLLQCFNFCGVIFSDLATG